MDAHCHYNATAFNEYRGACEFICNSTCEEDWAAIISAATADNHIHPAIGVHPWYWTHSRHGWPERMRQILIEHPNLTVGEIGMDKSRPHLGIQRKIFKIQYKMAAELGRTAHLHCVHAWDEMLKILQNNPSPPAIVVHRYSSSEQFMPVLRRSVDDKIYFSYREINSNRMRKIIMATPSSRILVETDGWRPQPDKIMELIAQIAFIRGCKTSDMADIIYNNSLQVINNGQIA